MDVVDYYRREIRNQGVWMAVYRQQSSTSYDSDGMTKVGAVRISVSTPSSSSETNTEGVDADVSFKGLIDPTDDRSETLRIGDELRSQPDGARRYSVETRDGMPNDFDPEIISVGLSKRSTSA